MTTLTKTIVATGASSGLGFELVKQLLTQPSPSLSSRSSSSSSSSSLAYRIILGARDVAGTQAAFDALSYDRTRHSLTVLPLELGDLAGTRSFARESLRAIGGSKESEGKEEGKLDYLLLNAGITGGNSAERRGPWGWCEALVVNHLSQHYLVHLFREKLVQSKSRVVFVSSGAIRQVSDTASLEEDVKAGSGVEPFKTYSQTKFIQLLGAHWWRRQLKEQGTVVAVSPGLIPGTGLGRGAGVDMSKVPMADAQPISIGAQSILRAFTRDDFPEDPQQIFLTSWGEWWSKEVYGLTLEKELQDKWCPSKEEIEKEAGLID